MEKVAVLKTVSQISSVLVTIFFLWYIGRNVIVPLRSILPQQKKTAPIPQKKESKNLPVVKDTFQLGINTSDNIIEGTLGYRFPDTMTVGQISRISALVTMYNLEAEIRKEVTKKSSIYEDSKISLDEVVLEKIRVSKIMQASIIDSSPSESKNFNITSLSSKQQFFELDEFGYTTWQWDVIPLKAGDFPLVLQLNILIPDEEISEFKSIDVYTKRIVVKSALPPQPKNNIIKKVTIFFVSLLAIATVFIFSNIRMRRTRRKKIGRALDLDGTLEKGKLLISENKISEALILLSDSLKGKEFRSYNEVISLQAKHKEVLRYERQGTEEKDRIELAKARLVQSILELIDELHSYK